MIEAVVNTTFTLTILTVMLIALTVPGWVTGQIVARQTRTLPVPFFLRMKVVRWALWYLAGTTALVALVLATRPVGTFETGPRVVFVAISLLGYAVAMISAFYIGWTSAAKRLARRGHLASAPPPMGTGDPQYAVEQDWRRLGHRDGDEYAPAQPHAEDDYRPATPLDQ